MGRGKRPATCEDIELLPTGWVGEIIDDELWAFPRPAMWHAWVASVLGAKLGNAFSYGHGREGGWWLLDEGVAAFPAGAAGAAGTAADG